MVIEIALSGFVDVASSIGNAPSAFRSAPHSNFRGFFCASVPSWLHVHQDTHRRCQLPRQTGYGHLGSLVLLCRTPCSFHFCVENSFVPSTLVQFPAVHDPPPPIRKAVSGSFLLLKVFLLPSLLPLVISAGDALFLR